MRPALLLAVLLALPAATALPAAVPVLAAGQSFASPALVVPAGTTVEWVGVALPHSVTTASDVAAAAAGRANDRANADADPDTFHMDLPQGARASHTFTTPGTYAYFCELHVRLGMVGVVTVV
ncbi:MAG TPA: plastocyanin/azurin family copper-binding protein [Candidatus Thermoplasmatota archaeon]|nr:plastocyanin/azurin family copper-binding protein [Candidatus Thermoplasmatota archaeon]